MNGTRSHRFLITALVAIALTAIATTQTVRGTYTETSSPSWPPHPKRIVNFHSANVPEFLCCIPPGETAELYTVPSDSWLVIQSIDIRPTISAGSFLFSWDEEFEGVRTTKKTWVDNNTTIGVLDGLGWSFRPGSRVVLHHTPQNANNVNVCGGVAFNGYLVK